MSSIAAADALCASAVGMGASGKLAEIFWDCAKPQDERHSTKTEILRTAGRKELRNVRSIESFRWIRSYEAIYKHTINKGGSERSGAVRTWCT